MSDFKEFSKKPHKTKMILMRNLMRIKLKNLYNRLKKKIILQKIIMKKKRNKIIDSSKALY
ncbi:hypothetical protein A9F99_16700 [Acinetobacter pittii]|nr:hypothetical protein A9F99_16700 [Acinetobacter pittii]